MDIQILMKKRTEPQKGIVVTIAPVDLRGKTYVEGCRSIFDDYGINALVGELEKDFRILNVIYSNIETLDPEPKGA